MSRSTAFIGFFVGLAFDRFMLGYNMAESTALSGITMVILLLTEEK